MVCAVSRVLSHIDLTERKTICSLVRRGAFQGVASLSESDDLLYEFVIETEWIARDKSVQQFISSAVPIVVRQY